MLLSCACSPPQISSLRDAAPRPQEEEPTATGGSPGGNPPPNFSFDAWPSAPEGGYEVSTAGEQVLVYAHSGSDLFSVNPQTLEFSRVGNFAIREPMPVKFLNDVTDIAVDKAGRIVGTTFNRLLQIDPKTADCVPVATLPPGRSFNGLSWIRTDGGEERLLATTLDGGVFRIDPATGGAEQVGALGGGLRSSGDIVSVASYGTLVTVSTFGGTDRLARVDPATGQATVIGDTGFMKIWGLGFWGNRVFGFTNTGQFILIDPTTGKGMLVESMPAFPFWGAGVTTSVPVIL